MNRSETKAAPRIALPWIVRMRYALAAGQLAAVAIARWLFGVDLPVGWMAVPPALVALSNFWVKRAAGGGQERASAPLIAWVFALDILCLTANLALSGGPNNPFTLLYFVQVTLSAAILTRRDTWLLGALSSLCYASLFWIYHPIPQLEMHHHGGADPHLVGMWIAFAIASALVAIYSGKISELLRENEASLLRVQEELARKDRLAALATLAAGAAHELSTPLATIAVVAKELEHYATGIISDNAVADDSRLVRSEVERCRAILWRMRIEGADPSGEPLDDVSAEALLSAVSKNFPACETVRISMPPSAPVVAAAPRRALEQALMALVKNAIEAGGAKPVDVDVREEADTVIIEVRDSGCGMTTDVLRHAGEPFFTTKAPGKGMGLGIFLVRTLADRLGGSFEIRSILSTGTTATLRLPRAQKRPGVTA